MNIEEKDDDKEEKGEKDNKKNKSKKKEENSKIEEEMRKKILKNKENKLEEIFTKIELRHKEITKQKPYYIYEPSLTSNTLLKDFEKEFWAMTKSNKCQNCGALAAKFKKMNNLRFFRIMPTEKDKKKMAKMGIDAEKGALEHGAGKREKEMIKKNKKKQNKEKKEAINEFKRDKKSKKEDDMDIEEESENEEEEENSEEIVDEEDEEKIKKGIESEVNTKKQNYLLSIEVMSHIEKLFLNDSGLISLLFGNMIYDNSSKYGIKIITSGINMFFIKDLIIPPNRFRPENSSFGGDENYYHYQTSAYRKILALDNDIKELSKKVNESKEKIIKEEDEMVDNNSKNNNNNIQKNNLLNILNLLRQIV